MIRLKNSMAQAPCSSSRPDLKELDALGFHLAPVAGPAAPVISSFSPDRGVVGDGITGATMLGLAGTAGANGTIKVYDGTTLLGSVSANSSGNWSYTSGTLAQGAHISRPPRRIAMAQAQPRPHLL
jgi:hypothetical protein